MSLAIFKHALEVVFYIIAIFWYMIFVHGFLFVQLVFYFIFYLQFSMQLISIQYTYMKVEMTVLDDLFSFFLKKNFPCIAQVSD